MLTNIGNIEECSKTLNKISQINKEGNFSYDLKCENYRRNASLSIRDIFCSKWVVFRIAICSLLWFSTIFARYAIEFFHPDKEIFVFMEFDNKSDILIRSLVNQILDAVSASIIYVPLINHFGRKKVAFVNLLLNGILFLILALLLNFSVNENILFIILFFIARFLYLGKLFCFISTLLSSFQHIFGALVLD